MTPEHLCRGAFASFPPRLGRRGLRAGMTHALFPGLVSQRAKVPKEQRKKRGWLLPGLHHLLFCIPKCAAPQTSCIQSGHHITAPLLWPTHRGTIYCPINYGCEFTSTATSTLSIPVYLEMAESWIRPCLGLALVLPRPRCSRDHKVLSQHCLQNEQIWFK